MEWVARAGFERAICWTVQPQKVETSVGVSWALGCIQMYFLSGMRADWTSAHMAARVPMAEPAVLPFCWDHVVKFTALRAFTMSC